MTDRDVTFAEARALILASVAPLAAESVALAEASGRVLAAAIIAPSSLPSWDNSAMDGFAVRVADCCVGASLRITASLAAGQPADGIQVDAGSAVRIMTGAPLPAGADAVVPIEEVGVSGGMVRITGKVTFGQHIRRFGEDVAAGTTVLAAGTLLRPPEIGLLAALGQSRIPLFRRPRVALLSTGDELVELGVVPGPGQIVNSNVLSLAAAVSAVGGLPFSLGIARDSADSLRGKLTEAFAAADVVITSAGVSAGDHDLVRAVLSEMGVRQLFWKLAIKPGRPTAFGLKDKIAVFSLPGNPVSTMVTFETLVRPALLRMQGHERVLAPLIAVRLGENVEKRAGRVHFMRVRVRREGGLLVADSAGDQNTGILSTMVRAHGLAVLPADRDRIFAGEMVDVLPLDATAFS